MRYSHAAVRGMRRARGVGLVAALTLLIILAAISVAVISLNTTQQASSSLDEQQTRAYLAARSGLEWALFNWNNNTGGVCDRQQGTFALPAGTTLSRFTVTVSCAPSPLNATMIRLTAVACNVPDGAAACPNANARSAEYVQRQVIADLPATRAQTP